MRGTPLRIVAVFDEPALAELTVLPVSTVEATRGHGAPAHQAHLAGPSDDEGRSRTSDRQGGPPYFLVTQIDDPAVGSYEAKISFEPRCETPAVTKKIRVFAYGAPAPPVASKGLWRTRDSWTARTENLYSAWVQHLFDAPESAQPSWPALQDVLRDPARNFLFDHRGAHEDDAGVTVRPDCADLPYFLRAYFAFKLGLPFGWSTCSRGDRSSPPACHFFTTNEDETPATIRARDRALADASVQSPLAAERTDDPAFRLFADFLRGPLADAVQSGAGRTSADDDESDYYPVAISTRALRPGTIFADPYGHVLVVSRRIGQTQKAGGVLLAVDGQPDGTVARKRFWRGNFLFAIDPALGAAGWKRFRPFTRDARGKLRRKTNRELSDPAYAAGAPSSIAYSTEQYADGTMGFYDRMDDVLSPTPRDPKLAFLETMQALEEQVRTRVGAVENGRIFLQSGKPEASMPDGAKLFETTGAWEDFSTPSRDLRLLIAVDVVRAFPARVARRQERYAIVAGKAPADLEAELDAALASELEARRVEYTRSDGSSWTLSLADVVRRVADLEVAYNPNDCVEVRWGAPAASPEAATCIRRAPPAQVARMEQVRSWFHDRTRPPRE